MKTKNKKITKMPFDFGEMIAACKEQIRMYSVRDKSE